MTRLRVLSWIGVLFVGQCFFLALGQTWVLMAPLLLALGWVAFLFRVVPEVTFRWGAIAEALVVAGVLGVGLHVFLRRLWRQLRADSAEASEWAPRWSAMLVALLVLLFGATMAAVGIGHHVGWMMSGRAPLVRSSWPQWNAGSSRSSVILCRSVRELVQAGTPLEQLMLKLLKEPATRGSAEALHVVWGQREHGERFFVVYPRDPLTLHVEGGATCELEVEGARPVNEEEVRAALSEAEASPPQSRPGAEAGLRGLP